MAFRQPNSPLSSYFDPALPNSWVSTQAHASSWYAAPSIFHCWSIWRLIDLPMAASRCQVVRLLCLFRQQAPSYEIVGLSASWALLILAFSGSSILANSSFLKLFGPSASVVDWRLSVLLFRSRHHRDQLVLVSTYLEVSSLGSWVYHSMSAFSCSFCSLSIMADLKNYYQDILGVWW